ncbi:MAG: hypothetical protein QG621_360, partial [Patescibacteria group bacterium]|nr:hypothetical protein [Patescibacteria group bacterium]
MYGAYSGAMKYKHHKLHTLPRLLVEQSVVAPHKRVGYLQLRDSVEK